MAFCVTITRSMEHVCSPFELHWIPHSAAAALGGRVSLESQLADKDITIARCMTKCGDMHF